MILEGFFAGLIGNVLKELATQAILKKFGRATLIGEKAQATLRGRPHGRLGTEGSGKGCLRGRPRGRLGSGGLAPATLRGRPGLLGSTQATGAILYIKSSPIPQT